MIKIKKIINPNTGKLIEDLSGNQYGDLLVLGLDNIRNKTTKKKIYWICECICGNTTSAWGSSLKDGSIKSCGCLIKKSAHSRREDLTGRVFGKLLVIGLDTERNNSTKYSNSYWICKCECGNIVSVISTSLKNGTTKSCGCLVKEIARNRMVDLTGMVFSKLTVIKLDEERTNKGKGTYWLCKCACGNPSLKSINSTALLGYKIKSCGCLKSEAGAKRRDNLCGEVYGKLTVLYRDEELSKNYRTYWVCKCECGNIKSILSGHLKSGKVLSCGCFLLEILSKPKIDPYDLIGKIIGDYEVVDIDSTKSNNIKHYYICKCIKCSCVTIKDRTVLLSNQCRNYCLDCTLKEKNSELHRNVINYIESLSYEIKTEHNCSILPINEETGMPLPFDVEIVKLRIIVEVNGFQHYKLLHKTHPWLNGVPPKEYLYNRQKIDLFKKNYALSQNFEYLEIPFWTEQDESYKTLIDNKIAEILAKQKSA